MNKHDLIKKLESYSNNEIITILVKDNLGNYCIVDLMDISITSDIDGNIEILLIPCL